MTAARAPAELSVVMPGPVPGMHVFAASMACRRGWTRISAFLTNPAPAARSCSRRSRSSRASCQIPQLPTGRRNSTSRGPTRIVSGLAGNTYSIFCDGPKTRYSEWMSGSAPSRNPAERLNRELMTLQDTNTRAPTRERTSLPHLTETYHGCRQGSGNSEVPFRGRLGRFK